MSYYRRVLMKHPEVTKALCRLGEGLAQQGHHNLATEHFKTVLAINPLNTNAYILLSKSFTALKKYNTALKILKNGLVFKPKSSQMHTQLAQLYTDQKQYENAQEHITIARKLSPGNAYSAAIEGNIHNWQGNTNKAIECYKKAIELNPTYSTAYYNLGHTLKSYGKFKEAITYLDKASKLNPQHVDTHIARAHSYWALGDFKKAWQDYEWRWKQHKVDPRPTSITAWNGNQPIKDKAILIYSEQGMGDTLQFIRFAQELKKQGAIVWCKPQKPLIPLLSLCPYIDHIFKSDEELSQIDFQAPIMSMPGLLGISADTIPAPKKYLYTNKEYSQQWKAKLAKDTNYKIGLCWRVNEIHDKHKLPIERRSIPTHLLTTLSSLKNVSLYSLQKMDPSEIEVLPQDCNLQVFADDFDKSHGRFMDTAALIENLDLVVSVDTSIAHLAAGLGKDVWMLLPFSSDCRWYAAKEGSPWYPTMKIFRQPKPGDWDTQFNKIATNITQGITA